MYRVMSQHISDLEWQTYSCRTPVPVERGQLGVLEPNSQVNATTDNINPAPASVDKSVGLSPKSSEPQRRVTNKAEHTPPQTPAKVILIASLNAAAMARDMGGSKHAIYSWSQKCGDMNSDEANC